jgi:hypothetical protein
LMRRTGHVARRRRGDLRRREPTSSQCNRGPTWTVHRVARSFRRRRWRKSRLVNTSGEFDHSLVAPQWITLGIFDRYLWLVHQVACSSSPSFRREPRGDSPMISQLLAPKARRWLDGRWFPGRLSPNHIGCSQADRPAGSIHQHRSGAALVPIGAFANAANSPAFRQGGSGVPSGDPPGPHRMMPGDWVTSTPIRHIPCYPVTGTVAVSRRQWPIDGCAAAQH